MWVLRVSYSSYGLVEALAAVQGLTKSSSVQVAGLRV